MHSKTTRTVYDLLRDTVDCNSNSNKYCIYIIASPPTTPCQYFLFTT